MKYYVTYQITAQYTAEVEADNLDEALKKANLKQNEEDFGVAEDVQGKIMYAESDSNDFWHRSELMDQKLKADIIRKH